MTNQYLMNSDQNGLAARFAQLRLGLPRRALIALVLMISLFAFEIFNFDTTRFALNNLMGEIRFLGFEWAAILAIAFCSIDFAGLVRLFTPERGQDEPKEVWYLMGAWLLGATMNALMTWWAVSLTLLNHEFGNEVMSREQLLQVVPIFVAVLVWLTRILFIGAFTVAGEHLFDFRSTNDSTPVGAARQQSVTTRPVQKTGKSSRRPLASDDSHGIPAFLDGHQPVSAQPGRRPLPSAPKHDGGRSVVQRNSRIKQRPPMPNGMRRAPLGGVQARSRNRN